jgi:hypothetical protein
MTVNFINKAFKLFIVIFRTARVKISSSQFKSFINNEKLVKFKIANRNAAMKNIFDENADRY